VIVKTIAVGMTQTNCYVVGCKETSQGVVIDPGAESGAILATIEEAGLEIRYVLNTHCHFDHIGANADVVEGTGAPLAVHRDGLPLLRMGGGAALFGLPGRESPEPEFELADGQLLEVGNLSFQVIHTPGHSPGSVTFYLREHGAAFDGDVLFAGGVGRADLPGASWETLMESIRGAILALPDETVLYPGHGPTTTVGRERQSNPWLK
jgi:glyoxylase-like metal-dependent hydrolase (beta-lactamase superfamily II)